MLVLTRKAGETIKIGDDIIIKICQTGKTYIKVGVVAPGKDIVRGEIKNFRGVNYDSNSKHDIDGNCSDTE